MSCKDCKRGKKTYRVMEKIELVMSGDTVELSIKELHVNDYSKKSLKTGRTTNYSDYLITLNNKRGLSKIALLEKLIIDDISYDNFELIDYNKNNLKLRVYA